MLREDLSKLGYHEAGRQGAEGAVRPTAPPGDAPPSDASVRARQGFVAGVPASPRKG